MTQPDTPKPKFRLARQLRKTMSPPEVRLWVRLRSRKETGFVIRRQHPVGPYVLDFYCPEVRLAIEVDGAQHTLDQALQHDRKRDAWLQSKNIETLRIPASFIMIDADAEADGLIKLIRDRLKSK